MTDTITFKRIDEIDFDVLGSMIDNMHDFNKPEVKEYLGTPANPVGDEALLVAEFYLDLMDIIDGIRMGNSLFTIFPYKHQGQWVFDDESKDLDKEPFVAGIDDILDVATKGAEKATVIFSAVKFPGSQFTMIRGADESGGNWYRCEELGIEGWLCPALFKYFDNAPRAIFVQVK